MAHWQSSSPYTPPSLNQFNAVNVFPFPIQEPITLHSFFAFVIPILLSLIQMKTSFPLEVDPVITAVSFVCLEACCLAFAAQSIVPAYASQFRHAMSLSGSIWVASLGCLILPFPWWWSIFIIIFIIITMVVLYKLLEKYYGPGLLARAEMGHWQSSSPYTPLSLNQFIALNVFPFPIQEPITFHSFFPFVIPILLSLIQMKTSFPLEVDPVTTTVSFVCLEACCLAFAAQSIVPAYASQFRHAMSLSGSIWIASLGCLILPFPWWWSIFIIIFIIIMMVVLFKLLEKYYGPGLWIRRRSLFPY